MQEFYTLVVEPTLQDRLDRSVPGIHKLRRQGLLPRGQYSPLQGHRLMWPVDEIEALIAANPSLVLKAKGGAQ